MASDKNDRRVRTSTEAIDSPYRDRARRLLSTVPGRQLLGTQDDIDQEAALVAVAANALYDPSRGTWQGHMQTTVSRLCSAVLRVDRHRHPDHAKKAAAARAAARRAGQETTPEALARVTGLTPKQVVDGLALMDQDRAVSRPVSSDTDPFDAPAPEHRPDEDHLERLATVAVLRAAKADTPRQATGASGLVALLHHYLTEYQGVSTAAFMALYEEATGGRASEVYAARDRLHDRMRDLLAREDLGFDD